MDDSSLDDFFAKKDKSKSKAKKKFTTDQLAKKLEESGKKFAVEAKTEKEKSPPVAQVTPLMQVVETEDDEWRDFEEEKEKDYSGLKIQNLQITETKDEDLEREKCAEDEDGESFKIRDSATGPWNKISNTNSMPESPPSPPPEVEVEVKEEVKSGVYRPPHARTTSGLQPTAKTKHSNKTAPEISSELHFPSLSAAADVAKKGPLDSDRGFEWVKRGSKNTDDVAPKGPKLDLGNKYTALSNSDTS